MPRPVCPLLNDHKQGYVCKVLNSGYIHDEDVDSICKNSEQFLHCVHFSNRHPGTQVPPGFMKRGVCPKCNSPQSFETLYSLLKDAHTQIPYEFKAYTCEACGFTELYRSR